MCNASPLSGTSCACAFGPPHGDHKSSCRSSPPRTMANVHGLSNPLGHNNCFLNVNVQALWHLDAFRLAFLAADADTGVKDPLSADLDTGVHYALKVRVDGVRVHACVCACVCSCAYCVCVHVAWCVGSMPCLWSRGSFFFFFSLLLVRLYSATRCAGRRVATGVMTNAWLTARGARGGRRAGGHARVCRPFRARFSAACWRNPSVISSAVFAKETINTHELRCASLWWYICFAFMNCICH